MLALLLAKTDYPFLDIMWTMFIFFAWVIWIWLLIMVLADNFRRSDQSGWAKAGWTVLLIFFPLLGALIYMIARPSTGTVEAPWTQPAAAHNGGSAADELTSLARLRDTGEISAEEYERLKSRMIAV